MTKEILHDAWQNFALQGKGTVAPVGGKALSYMGLVGFLAFALALIWGPAVPQIAMVLMLPYFIAWVRSHWAVVRASSLFWMSLAFCSYGLIRSLAGALQAPETFSFQVKGAGDLFQVGGLWALPIIPWLLGARGGIGRALLLGLAMAGFGIQALLLIEWGDLAAFIKNRPRLMVGPNTLASMVGIFLIGLLTVGRQWSSSFAKGAPWYGRAGIWTIWLGYAVLLVGLLIAAQSRASWLAATLTIPIVVGVLLYVGSRSATEGRKGEILAGLVAFGLVVASVIWSQWGLLENRFHRHFHTIERVANLEFSSLPVDSVGIRIRMYEFALSKLPEEPLFGYSPGGVRPLLHKKAGPIIDGSSHVHNMPLQLAMETGLLGFGIFYAMVVVSIREIIRARADGRLSLEWTIFWLGSVAFLAIQGMFDARAQTYHYGVLLVMLGALPMACQLERLGRAPLTNEGPKKSMK